MASMKMYPGVILAGGKSRRMGRDKAFMEIEGKPLIRRIASALREVCGTVAIVGGDEKKYAGLGLPWYQDSFPDCGPLGGIHTALKHFNADVFISACDLPSINPSLIRFLLSRHDPGNHPVTLARSPESVQPLFGVYNPSVLPSLERFLAGGERQVLRFVQGSGATIITLPSGFSPGILANLNSPADYLKYRNHHQSRS